VGLIEVRIDDIDATDAMRIVYELRDMDWQQGKDFDFSYHHTRRDSYSYEIMDPMHAIFFFYRSDYATMFALKYL
jgi:hypothetical protein